METGEKSQVKLIKIDDEISLKQLERSDAPEIYTVVNEQNEYLKKWLPFVNHTLNSYNSDEVLVTMISLSNFSQGHLFVIQYCDRFAGFVGLRNYDKLNQHAEIGYWLSQHFLKRGIATRAVIALLAHIYEELALNKVYIKSAVGNIAGSNIPRRLGFHFEGIDRKSEHLKDNVFLDLEVYSMLKSEYESLKLEEKGF